MNEARSFGNPFPYFRLPASEENDLEMNDFYIFNLRGDKVLPILLTDTPTG